MAELDSTRRSRRELFWLLTAWFVLAVAVILFAQRNLTAPGLYYDEAVFAGLAKDFVNGRVHGQHMPDHEIVMLSGRPFPLFVQTYLGALKCWMLVPAFWIFGSTFAVLRGSNVFWELIALLLLMLGTLRWLGLPTAIGAGLLLAFDPTFFFISTLDWGAVAPSFVCRCACFLFAVRWAQKYENRDAFLLGLFAGLGFFNKADFAVFLIAITLAALVCYWRHLIATFRHHSTGVAIAGLGFAIGAGPMILKIPRMVALTTSGPHPNSAGQFGVKLRTMLSMYDGSHFYRLMNVGGVFERMYDGAIAAKTPFGIVLSAAVILYLVLAFRRENARSRPIIFLMFAAALVTLGVFLLPDAIRIHHATLVYPLPHLVLAATIVTFWQNRVRSAKIDLAIAAVVAIAVVALIAAEFQTTVSTEKLIRETGGRGRWSESLNSFCRENRDQSHLKIVSLDWGFNEQLAFLTGGPELSEPFWQFNQTLPPLPPDPNCIYLAHPAEYSVLKYDVGYLSQLQAGGANVEITPHLDRQNQVAFYTIRFRSL